MFRSHSLLLAAVGLWMAHPLPGQEPAPLKLETNPVAEVAVQPSDNQKIADTIAAYLRQSPRMTSYRIHVSFQDGVATLTGAVPNEAQRQEALRIAQSVPGVARIQDGLTLAAITPVQALGTAPGQPPATALPPALAAVNGAAVPEPMPIYQSGPVSPYDLNPPKMPPHAWPTYAPYNNYSRVAYPEQYPYQAWPFIGPFYPFPKVPLGWRSIKLEWEDGHWWYKKYATPHDWWRIRYW